MLCQDCMVKVKLHLSQKLVDFCELFLISVCDGLKNIFYSLAIHTLGKIKLSGETFCGSANMVELNNIQIRIDYVEI